MRPKRTPRALALWLIVMPALAAAQGKAPYDAEASAKAVLDVYKTFDFSRCDGGDCGGVFSAAAGIKTYSDSRYSYQFNPRLSMTNPDPEWIPGWDKLPSDDGPTKATEVYRALAQAASNRTWQARCHADYAKYEELLLAKDEEMKAAIAERVAEPNPYTRVAKLLALRPRDDDKIPSRERAVGGRYELEVAIKAAYKDAGWDYVYALMRLSPPEELMRILRPRQDSAFERDAYCLAAAERGLGATPALPSGPVYHDRVRPLLKPVISPERAKEVEAKLTSLRESARKGLIEGVNINDPISGGAPSSVEVPGHPGLVHFESSDLKVKSVKKDGDKVVAELFQTSTREFPISCVRTKRVLKIEPDGTLVYEEKCTWGKMTADFSVIVTFAALPEGAGVAVGDSFELFGVHKGTKEKKLVDTKSKIHTASTTEIDAEALIAITRDGKQKTYLP
jgi:hypothetical protein